MHSKERILTAIRRKEPDRVPCSPLVGPNLIEQMTQSEWDALLHLTDVTMSVGGLGDAQIFGGQTWIDRCQTIRDGNSTITLIETPQGMLRARTVVTPESTWQAEHFFKGREDIDKLLSIPYAVPRFNLDGYESWTARLGDEGLVALGIPSPIRFCLGFFGSQTLYLMIADDANLVEQLVATMTERLEAVVTAYCNRGVSSFWMGGSEHCGPGVVNPGLFKRLVTPYDKRIVEIIHDDGGVVNYHTHGKLKAILDDIAEIGVDVMSPIESGLRGDVTLAEVKARIGDRVCLKGNLDDMAFLALESEAAVRAATEECIRQAAKRGGYILSGTDANVYSPEWLKNFLVMAQVARQHTYP